MNNTFTQFENLDNPALVFKCIAGSRAYGTHNENSDTDTRGIFLKKASDYLCINEPIDYCSNKTNDIVYYSLKRFIQLASKANPNILELLFSPEDCVLKTTQYFQMLQKHRSKFVTTQIVDTHINYANAQIKKATGKNKRVYNPQPKEPPSIVDFCFFVDAKSNLKAPARPMYLKDCIANLSQLACSKLEHSQGVYRVYKFDTHTEKMFSETQILCQNIPVEDEGKYIGLMLFNENAYKRALTEHAQYWEWKENRNQYRWISQENGECDYDAKNMMHLFRILLSAKNILEHQEPLVRVSGDKLAFLLDIKSAKYRYEDLIKMSDQTIKDLYALAEKSKLPNSINIDFCNKLLVEITSEWENNL